MEKITLYVVASFIAVSLFVGLISMMGAFVYGVIEDARHAALVPKWEDVPKEANWIAQDASGAWHCFIVAPDVDEKNLWWTGWGICFLKYTNLIGNWRESLRERPAR